MENSFNQPPIVNLSDQPSSRFDKIYSITRSPLGRMIIGAFLLTTLVAIIILITNPNSDTPITTAYEVSTDERIHIDNLLDILPDFPEDYQDSLEAELYTQVTTDLIGSFMTTPASGAIIRENSVNAIDVSDALHIGDFIIDIPSVEFSYQVSYKYGREDGFQIEPFASAVLYCIEDEDLRIYPDFTAEYCTANPNFRRSDASLYLQESEDSNL